MSRELQLLAKGHRSNTNDKDLGIQHIRGDRNCYFRALSFSITGSEDNHKQLRDIVVDSIKISPLKEQLENYLAMNIGRYLNETGIMLDGAWATDVEIMATASVLKLDIEVFAIQGRSKEWLRYPASTTMNKHTPSALYIVNANNHFDVVIDVDCIVTYVPW